MAELMTGEQAPRFHLRDAGGEWVDLKDFAGSKVVLYFYPAALTPGCTVEAVDFSGSAENFHQKGYAIVGISPDEPERLSRFISRYDLKLTLLSDPTHDTLTAYGAWGDRTLWGKVITGVIRSTFIIDVDAGGEGRILQAQYGVRATGHVKRLQQSLNI